MGWRAGSAEGGSWRGLFAPGMIALGDYKSASDAGLAECGDHLAHNVSLSAVGRRLVRLGFDRVKARPEHCLNIVAHGGCLGPVRPPADGVRMTFRVATFPALECLSFVSRLLRPHERQRHDTVTLRARIVRWNPAGRLRRMWHRHCVSFRETEKLHSFSSQVRPLSDTDGKIKSSD